MANCLVLLEQHQDPGVEQRLHEVTFEAVRLRGASLGQKPDGTKPSGYLSQNHPHYGTGNLAPFYSHLVVSHLAPPCPRPRSALALVLPCPALPCPALPCPALPCPALPCPALPIGDLSPSWCFLFSLSPNGMHVFAGMSMWSVQWAAHVCRLQWSHSLEALLQLVASMRTCHASQSPHMCLAVNAAAVSQSDQ